MMLSGLFLVGFLAGGAYGQLTPIGDAPLKVFIDLFRQTLLEKVAIEVNKTLEASNELTPLVDACKSKINTTVESCQICAKSKCKKSPTFNDILNLANPAELLKGPLADIGSKVTDAVDLLGDKAGGFINYFKDLNLNLKLPNEIKFVFKAIENGIKKALDSLKSLGKDIKNIAIDTGSLFGDGFNKLKDVLGKRRRKREAISPEVKQCMQKCSSCTPLLLPTEDEVVAAVCGTEIVEKNNTLQQNLKKIQDIYDHALDKVNNIVKSVKVDFTTLVGIRVTNYVITVYKNGKYISYKTKVPVNITDLAVAPARPMALEYWLKF